MANIANPKDDSQLRSSEMRTVLIVSILMRATPDTDQTFLLPNPACSDPQEGLIVYRSPLRSG